MVTGNALMVLLLISGCANYDNSYYGKLSVNPSNVKTNSILEITARLLKDNAYSVPTEDRDKHEECVYFSLEHVELGESCSWYSSNGSTMGEVKVVSYRPQGSGYCVTLFNSIRHKGKWSNWQDVACTRSFRDEWKFVSQ